MAIFLSVFDPKQVSSPSSFEFQTGEPAQTMVVFSGIAIPEFWTNHDEEVKQDEIIVRLGIHVSVLERSVVHVGLASIKNDETNFLFALDTAKLEVESGSGELLLKVTGAILGEHTAIHRFGYQGVAHVRKVTARISGTVLVPRDIVDMEGWSAADIASSFEITANRVEIMPAPPGGFTSEILIPVAVGQTGMKRATKEVCFVDYAIDACPFNVPLRVEVKLVGHLAIHGVVVGQVRGARPVILTGLQPDATGVDFSVGRLPIVR